MTCFSYLHSRYADGKRLWCALHRGPAIHRCPQFCYEPGTDEVER